MFVLDKWIVILTAVCSALALLFALGYFLGAIDKKKEFLKNTANRLIPEKEIKVIDFKKEVKKEQEMNQAAEEIISSMEAKTKE